MQVLAGLSVSINNTPDSQPAIIKSAFSKFTIFHSLLSLLHIQIRSVFHARLLLHVLIWHQFK